MLALAVCIACIRVYYNLTDDFRVSHITHPVPEKTEWNFPLSEEEHKELAKILDQDFIYLGKGAQVYAFGSIDGKYVIKFFKFKHLKPSVFIEMIPAIGPLADFKEKNIQRKIRKLEGVFEGHVIGYTYDKKNSGLIALHLNPTKTLGLHVRLIDKIGMKWNIDLDPVVFVIQKRGETLRTIFGDLLDQNKAEMAVKKATQVLDMYVDEYSRGVWDRDHGISHNIGFIGDEPFHLDVGKLSYRLDMRSPSVYQDDLRLVAKKMDAWVEEHYPEQAFFFHSRLQKYLEELLFQKTIL